jgi:hypothetical protein
MRQGHLEVETKRPRENFSVFSLKFEKNGQYIQMQLDKML